MKLQKIGLIGGTGMGDMLGWGNAIVTKKTARTPYGVVDYSVFPHTSPPIVMVSRHENSGEYLLPHKLNWQAYMYVLGNKLENVDLILTTSAVGTPYKEVGGFEQGDLIVPSDIIDYVQDSYTFARKGFSDSLAFHRPSTDLLCPHLRQALDNPEDCNPPHLILANSIKGPRFETPAEMKVRLADGVDVVGMTTAFPEAVLAGELGIPYAVLCGVTNIAPAEHNGMEVTEAMKVMLPKMKVCILQAIDWLVENEHPDECPCRKGKEESVFC